jgi:acyl carrier protein
MKHVSESCVISVIAEVLELEDEDVSLQSSLVDDLDADSLDLVDISFSLGKKLGMKMPTKTTLVVANEMTGDAPVFVKEGRLTSLGADLLIQSPSEYTADEIQEGVALSDLLGLTTVNHWFNLSKHVAENKSKSGADLITSFVESFCKEQNIEIEQVPA